jgi:hypothetical protein
MQAVSDVLFHGWDRLNVHMQAIEGTECYMNHPSAIFIPVSLTEDAGGVACASDLQQITAVCSAFVVRWRVEDLYSIERHYMYAYLEAHRT